MVLLQQGKGCDVVLSYAAGLEQRESGKDDMC